MLPPASKRLRFRLYDETDVQFVSDLFADEYARKYYPSMASAGAARRWIDWNLANYREHGFGLWVVENVATGQAIGDCGLTVQEVAGEAVAEVGYHTLHGFRRRGYATEAARACVAYALDDLRLGSVCSIVDPRNEASIAVAARIHPTKSSFANTQGESLLLFASKR